MKIRLVSPVIGAFTGKPGDVVERPDHEAQNLIRCGAAIPFKDADAPLETATLKEPMETAKA